MARSEDVDVTISERRKTLTGGSEDHIIVRDMARHTVSCIQGLRLFFFLPGATFTWGCDALPGQIWYQSFSHRELRTIRDDFTPVTD